MNAQLFSNGTIWTGDAEQPWASSMLLSRGKILAIGSAESVAEQQSTELIAQEQIDLAGQFVMPGLHDVHNHHFLAGHTDLFECSFLPTDGLAEVLTTISQWAAQLPPGAWVTGGSVGSGLFNELSTPQALRQLDQASHGHPVLVTDDSKHNRWANSAALRQAGVDAKSIDPAGGQILRDQSGQPTGVLIEGASVLLEKALAAQQQLSVEDAARASQRGIEILHSHGITAFQDAATSLPIMRALKHLDDAGALKAWVVSSLQVNDFIFGTDPVGKELIELGENYRSTHHRPDFVKIFLDGVPPTRTAAFLEAYLPDDEHGKHFHGHTSLDPAELLDWLRWSAHRGLSAKIHCTGDASVRAVLDAVQVLRAEGFGEQNYQIAHGQFVHPDDLARFAELNVHADISPPLWFPGVIPEAIKTVLPAERAIRLQPNRDLLDSGAIIAGGSDWPVSVSPNPWEGIQGLVTRADPSGNFGGTLWPEQAIGLGEALSAYTSAAAKTMRIAELSGSLEVGKSADFIVLDRNPFETPHDQLIRTKTLQTWFAGERVYQAD
ncbi:amidohydrolase [Psychromicrobium lacuslunae]|uniref:Amidohydrolase n=1 Tax=Psychromicrobium lacuslunae TaxID=1618207 RepID=A0A0D4BY98_9MICC|nr:amidohydrolase [Psychromicrobium lacuslunae]AJT41308.1 amidohydrolase [Psychromicrobium lacuslunae]